MPKDLTNPIATSHSQIQNHLKMLNEFMEHLDKAKAIGTPMADTHEQHRQYLVNQFDAIKQNYFRNKP